MIVPVNAPEHFTSFPANDNLREAVIAAVGALFAIGAGPPFCFTSAGENAVCFQTFCNPVHRVALQIFTVDAFYHLCLFRIDDEISICILGVAEEVIVIYLYLAILVANWSPSFTFWLRDCDSCCAKEASVFLANRLMDLVMIMSMFPASQSSIMRLKSSRFLVLVPEIPSSA